MLESLIQNLLALQAKPAFAVIQIPNDPADLSNLDTVFGNLVEVVMALGGFACFIFIIAGAFQYITSGGDDKAVMKAKATITYAIAGLVAVAAVYFVIDVMFAQTWGLGQIEFTLPQ